MLTLFYAPGTVALASHIALIDAGAEYRLHRVDFSTNEQRGSDHLAVNPRGWVPSLVTDKGIDRNGGNSGLYRADVAARPALAAGRPLRLCAASVLQRLPCRHPAYRPCPWPTRRPLDR